MQILLQNGSTSNLFGGAKMINSVHNMKLLRSRTIFIVVLIAASPVWAQWENALIDTITNTQIRKETELQSLDLDSVDYVHLAWRLIRDGGGWRIFYATNSPAGVWLSPQEVGDSTQASFSPGLAVSPISDHPFIIFEQNSEIYLAYQPEAIWQRQQITSNSQLDCSPTIAIDSLGLIHLAWITDDPGSGEYKIAYALGDSVNWNIQTLAGSNLGPYGTGASPNIAVSPQGVAHVVYRGGTYGNYHIHHAWNDSPGGSNWSYEIMMSGNANDFSCALVIETGGDLHLAVSGNDGFGFPGRVYYFYQPEGQGWQPFELASLSYSATVPSIDVDESGSPHIVWMEISGNMYTGNIFYSHKEAGGSWQVSSVIGGDYFFPSFKVDQQGFGHIGCHTGGNTGIYDIYHIRSGESLTSLKEYPYCNKGFSSYYLSQNYPNPFNYYTYITYYIPTTAMVSLKVYNTLGEEVAVLVNKFQPAGNHHAKWDASEIVSGIYFYRLQVDAFTQTRNCLILK